MENKEVKLCKNCGQHEQYDSNGLCTICNYQKMLGVDIVATRSKLNLTPSK